MYHKHISRYRDITTEIVHILKNHSREMALDPRFYASLGGPPGPNSATNVNPRASPVPTSASYQSGTPSITSNPASYSTASAAALRSNASSPSLRAREGVMVPANGTTTPTSSGGGGNVKVVVRVRGFLPRGMVSIPIKTTVAYCCYWSKPGWEY